MKTKTKEEIESLFDDLLEYFEPKADVDASGDPLEFRGNKEMSFVTEIERLAAKINLESTKGEDGETDTLTAEEARRLDLRFRQQQIPQNSKGTK